MKQYSFFILLFCSPIFSFAQTAKKKNYFPLWTFHQDSINIHGISVGLWTIDSHDSHFRNTNTNGIKAEIIGVGLLVPMGNFLPIEEADSNLLEKLKDSFSENINGLNLSGTGTICYCQTNGFAAGLIGQIQWEVNGLSTTSLVNITNKLRGVMIALFNTSHDMSGVQIGLSNEAYQAKGIQIGLLNKTINLYGIQLGLWNKNKHRKLPLINWNFKQQFQ